MAVLAVLYGVVKEGSVWYPINLLAAAASAKLAALPTEGLRAFHADGFALACGIHLLTSLMVGILYGVMLPMFPRRPILLGGVVAPLLWTGLLHATLAAHQPGPQRARALALVRGLADRLRRRRGAVVTRTAKVRTLQSESFAVRAGVETPGLRTTRSLVRDGDAEADARVASCLCSWLPWPRRRSPPAAAGCRAVPVRIPSRSVPTR